MYYTYVYCVCMNIMYDALSLSYDYMSYILLIHTCIYCITYIMYYMRIIYR